jgi:crotonobetainyl-CoA:carnitine CoA-transferase CaiB-like acyl-CoA transferase
VENRAVLTPILAEIFGKRTTHEWVEGLEAAGVPSGPINNIKQVFEEPQVIARGVKIEVDHAVAGKVPLVASPMRFSETPVEYRLAPPTLGQHTDEILRGVLGLDDAAVTRLHETKIL